jgi:hypothetical protein
VVEVIRSGLLVIGLVGRFLDLNLIQSRSESVNFNTIRQIMGELSRRGSA